MKIFSITTVTILALAISANAQRADAITPVDSAKVEKAKQKAAKEEMLTRSLKEAGLSKEEILKAKAIIKESEQKGKALEIVSSIRPNDFVAKRREIDAQKKEQLIAIMGKERYKKYQEAKSRLTMEHMAGN